MVLLVNKLSKFTELTNSDRDPRDSNNIQDYCYRREFKQYTTFSFNCRSRSYLLKHQCLKKKITLAFLLLRLA